MKKDRILYAIHILENIEKIRAYVGDSKDLFFKEEKTYDAVLRKLQTLSESTKHLDEELKQKNVHIPWEKIWGLRNVLVHEYLGSLIPGEIWLIIQNDLSILEQAIKSFYKPSQISIK